MLKMTEMAAEPLYKYLLSHEQDIANQMNDYGDLLSVFVYIFYRQPEA